MIREFANLSKLCEKSNELVYLRCVHPSYICMSHCFVVYYVIPTAIVIQVHLPSPTILSYPYPPPTLPLLSSYPTPTLPLPSPYPIPTPIIHLQTFYPIPTNIFVLVIFSLPYPTLSYLKLKKILPRLPPIQVELSPGIPG